jgi:hypothetical protein
MTGTSIWPMLILKIPILVMIGIVWWVIHKSADEPLSAGDEGHGGSKLRADPHPRPRLPRKPRRGPHGTAPAPAPSRVRTVHARACKIER